MAGFGGSQFRESAIVRNADPEPLDDRAQLTAPREWAVLACLALALAALVIWGALGSVERTLRSDGVLVFPGERRTVLSTLSGAVAEVLTGEGERVAAGQAILRIAPAGLERPGSLSAASVRALEDRMESATGAVRAEAKRLLASARALLDDLASLREPVEMSSPGDGVIAAIFAAPGESIAPGSPVAELVYGEGGRLDAVAIVPRGDSWPLAAGMAARVTVETAQGRLSLPAELAEIAPRAADPPGWLGRMLSGAGTRGRGHLLRLTISDPLAHRLPPENGFGRSLVDGTPCRIEIVLERTSPFGLLIRR